MNISKENHRKVEPVSALIIYDNHYIETCRIDNGRFGPKKPLSIKALKKFKETLSIFDADKNVTFKGLISPKLIYVDSNPSNPIIVWYSNPQFRLLLMNGITKKRVHVPKLVYCYCNDSLHVFAAKQFHKTITLTKLYEPPFPNVQAKNRICFGNVKLSESNENINDIIDEYENAFFNSYFTEPEDELKLYWQNATDKEFDHSILKPNKTYEKIENLIKSIERNSFD